MKFAKYLSSETVPEWRAKYLDYRGLKKYLKRISGDPTIEDALYQHSVDVFTRPSIAHWSNRYDGLSTDVMHLNSGEAETILGQLLEHATRPELDFFDKLDREFNKTVDFYASSLVQVGLTGG
jgi:hypothetical protein